MEKWMSYGFRSENIPNYDCSVMNRSPEEWYAQGTVNYPLGIIFIIFGFIIHVVYSVILLAMWRIKGKNTCYRIMFILGIYDIANIFFSSTLSGVFWLLGAVYCTHPDLIYISGALTLASWCCACLSCLILVINRLVDLWNPILMKKLFDGKPMYLWIGATVLYGLYFVFFTTPVLFNTKLSTYFLCPFILGTEEEMAMFFNFGHNFNNMCVVFGTCILYTVLLFVLGHKYGFTGINNINKYRRSIIIQCLLISTASQVTAGLYVYAQFFPIPTWLVLAAHLIWQFANGVPVFIYLILNKTIRNEVKRMMGMERHIQVSISNSNQGPPTLPSARNPQSC